MTDTAPSTAGMPTNIKYSKVSVSTQTQNKKGDMFTLRCIFKYKDVDVNVSNPFFRMRPVGDADYMQFQAVDTYALNSDYTQWALSETGYIYQITIDPTNMEHAWYEIFFEGDVTEANKVTHLIIKGSIQISALSRAERISNYVMNMLAENDLDGYVITAGKFHHFQAKTLMHFIPMGIMWINTTGARIENYNIETMPEDYDIFLIEYVFAKAMLQKARAMIDNDMQLSDNKSLSQNKYEKYIALYNAQMDRATNDMKSYKLATPPNPFGHKRSKYPLYIIYSGLTTGNRNFWIGNMMNLLNV